MSDDPVYYGHERVSAEEKTRRVDRDVFARVAARYDRMNDLLSLGLHRPIKHLAIDLVGVGAGERVLDLAGGTGDLTARFAERVGSSGAVVLADLNAEMIDEGRRRLDDRGICNVQYVQTNAEALPFASGCFGVVAIGFGLRNVARKDRALAEMHRVLAPGGRVLVVEFSKPRQPLLRQGYKLWQSVWPSLGSVVAGDAAPYRYLVDSIETHPDQETLRQMLLGAGFVDVRCHDVMGGIVALHLGRVPA